MIGKTIGGYRIISQIGMGGMATVFKAHDAKMDRHVALKILPQQYSKDPSFLMRFEREAKAIAQLEHLHILPIFDYGEDDGISYMAMRLMETGTLTDYIKAESPIPLAEIARLLQQIAGALDHAHSHGILHRDIKPGNILVDAGANAYLTDFGIAKMVESSIDLTGTGIVGTPQYMSPEQCFGTKDITPASDQYSLGVVLYEMVTGRTPYQAETPLAIINMQIIEAPLPPPTELRPDLPDATESVILKTLSRDPQIRYPSCSALATAFMKSLEGYQAPAEPIQKRKPAVVAPEYDEEPTKIAPPPVVLADEHTQMLPSKRGVPAWLYAVIVFAVLIAGFFFAYQLMPDFQEAVNSVVANPTPTATASNTATATITSTATTAPTNTPATPLVVPVRLIMARSGPGADFDVLMELDADMALDVTGISEDGAWLQVILPDGQQGWIASSSALVDTYGDMNIVPMVILPTETPIPTATSTPTNTAIPTATNTLTPTTPLTEIDTPSGISGVEPCNYSSTLSGYCIFDENGAVQRVLTDRELEDWSQASWNPDGTQFTFSAMPSGGNNAHDARIYVVNVDGSELYSLPQRSNDLRPTWSPDGQWIAYHSGCDLVMSSPDGSTTQVLWHSSQSGGCVERIQWSPDSQWIVAYAIVDRTGEEDRPQVVEIRLLPVYGGDIVTLAHLEYEGQSCSGEVAFSPDGQQIVYFDETCQIVLVDRDGTGEQTQLREFPFWWTGSAYPQWGIEREIVNTSDVIQLTEPDNVIYAETCFSGSQTAICTYSSDGVQLSQFELESGFGVTSRPGWSPDGQQLTFGGMRVDDDGTMNVPFYIVNADGTDFHSVPQISNDLDPAWSPDGEWIAIHSGCDLTLSSPDGSQTRTIWRSSMAGCVMSPQWSPDSQWVVMIVASAGGATTAHDVWTVSLETGDIYEIASFDNSAETHTNYDSYSLAFSPDGQQVAYYDENGQVVLANRDGEGDRQIVTPFPVWWTNQAYPQWGIEREAD